MFFLIYTSHGGTTSFIGDELVKRILKDEILRTIIKKDKIVLGR